MLVPFDLVARSGAESSGDRSAPNTHGNTSKGGGHEFGHNGEQPAGEDTADSISDTSTEHPRCHPTRSNQAANRVASVLQLDDGQQSQHTRPRPQYHRANPGITQGPSHGGHQESFNLQMNILMNQHHIGSPRSQSHLPQLERRRARSSRHDHSHSQNRRLRPSATTNRGHGPH